MVFNFQQNRPDFVLILIQGQTIARVQKAIILGMWITQDLKWNDHVNKITKKAAKHLYLLEQLKKSGLDSKDLKCFFIASIRTILEPCQVFHCGLPKYLSDVIERISQKWALRIILPDLSYEDALATIDMKSVWLRRLELCIVNFLKFHAIQPKGCYMILINGLSLPGLSKTARPGDRPKVSFHAAFPSDVDLCPVKCLRCYEAVTSGFKPSDPSLPNNLFLSYIRPHKPVTSSSVARWTMKSVFELAGIDTSIFTAHSVRGAFTSGALNQGISIPDILKMASLSNESTFQKFYCRPQFNSSLVRQSYQ